MAVQHLHPHLLHLPPFPPDSSSDAPARSCSTSTSSSSLFSDIQPGAKTYAFFASPWASPDVSSTMPTESSPTPSPARSLTTDFFSTPVRSPSPPPTTTTRSASAKAASILAAIHPSRIFPSRYTSRVPRDDDDDNGHSNKVADPGLTFLEFNDDGFSLMPSPYPQPPRALSPLSTLSTSSSSESTHSQIVPEPSRGSVRLPTPPPPPPPASRFSAHGNDATPRPAHLEPVFTTKPSTSSDDDFDADPAPGCVITTHPPRISLSSPTLTVTPPPDATTALDVTPPTSTNLHLLRPLGQGAFSSVWLAEDHSSLPLTLKSKKSIREMRRQASLSSRSRKSSIRSVRSASGGTSGRTNAELDATSITRDGSIRMRNLRSRVKGTRPVGFSTHFLDERHGEMGKRTGSSDVTGILSSDGEFSSSVMFSPPLSASNSNSSVHAATMTLEGLGVVSVAQVRRKKSRKQRLVAVKMTPRRAPGVVSSFVGNMRTREEEEEERTRVGFVREVEILKHISHPNVTVLLEHMSTPSHHILVLPYHPGGDLLNLVNNDIAWSKLGENVLRRIWCELCKAVGWMHGVGLVHRDIKLENILLTTQVFSSLTPTSPHPTLNTLPVPPKPLIKITDFGLSRFIKVDESTGEGELLWTRCGSEAYAAPELVMGTGSVRAQAQADARRLRRRRRPSSGVHHHEDEEEEEEGVRGFYDARETDAWACGVVLYALVGRRLPFGEGVSAIAVHNDDSGGRVMIGGDGTPGHGHGRGSAAGRRQWLMRIARGEYEWPEETTSELPATDSLDSNITETNTTHHNDRELIGQQLIYSEGAKRIVGRLLVRDPRKRARIMDLWEDRWMWGPGGGLVAGMSEDEWRVCEREREREREVDGSSGGIGLGIDFGDSTGHPLVSSVNRSSVDSGRDVVSDAVGVGMGEGSDEVTVDMDYVDLINEEQFLDEGTIEEVDNVSGDHVDEGEGEGDVEVEIEEVVDGEEGWLLDQEGIGSVARQELV